MAENMITPRDLKMMRIACSIKPNAPKKIVRAVIASKDGRIISWGNTDRVKGCEYSDSDESKGKHFNSKYSMHAEVYAIIRSINPKGCTIYVSKQPCNECAKLIIHSGITRVVYRDGQVDEGNNLYWDISLEILEDAQVLCAAIQPEDIIPLRKFNADIVVGLIVDKKGKIVKSPDEPEKSQPKGNNAKMQPSGNENRDFDLMREAERIGKKNETTTADVGALIVDSMGKTVSSGCPRNRKPKGCKRKPSDNSTPCGAAYKYAIHAVEDAILGHNVKGCTLYLTKYPCNASARMISVAGISRLVIKNNAGNEHGGVEDILKGAEVKKTFLDETD